MNLQGVVIPEVNEDFVETMSNPENRRGGVASLVGAGLLPEGVDANDPRVIFIIKACVEASQEG